MDSFFDSVRQTKESWNPPDGAGQEQVRGLTAGSPLPENGWRKADPPNICKWLEFSTSTLKEETAAVEIWRRVYTVSYLRLPCLMLSIHTSCILSNKHGGRILFRRAQSVAIPRNFPRCSFQIVSPSLPPVPQVMRNWMGFGVENTVIATYALHFVNEEIWILLQVGASTRELKSHFYDLSYITPSAIPCSYHIHFKLLKAFSF